MTERWYYATDMHKAHGVTAPKLSTLRVWRFRSRADRNAFVVAYAQTWRKAAALLARDPLAKRDNWRAIHLFRYLEPTRFPVAGHCERATI